MKRIHKALVILMVATFGAWGCAQGNGKPVGNSERLKALESKCAKLEEDYKAVANARDQVRRKLTQVEQEVEKDKLKMSKEQEMHKLLVKERDELRAQIVSRTTERDAIQTQFEELRKGIRGLLGRVDAAIPVPNQPEGTSTVELPGPKG